jgi:crossover junction endodeoxyribonuclease RusA
VTPVTTDCLFIATYFWSKSSLIDNDNWVKPIQDALIGLVFVDDRQITDTTLRKTNVYGPFFIGKQPQILVEAIRLAEEFVYVRIEEMPDHRRLL